MLLLIVVFNILWSAEAAATRGVVCRNDFRSPLERALEPARPAKNCLDRLRGSQCETFSLDRDDGRFAYAERILSIWHRSPYHLSDRQKSGLLLAHKIGRGRTYFTYTFTDLLGKAKVLREAGFSPQERRLLMEWGVVGDFDERDFANSDLNAQERMAFLRGYQMLSRYENERVQDPRRWSQSPRLGAIDYSRLLRHIEYRTRQINMADAAGVTATEFFRARAKSFREMAEFEATNGSLTSALERLKDSALDYLRLKRAGELNTLVDRLAALRTVELNGNANLHSAFDEVLTMVAREYSGQGGEVVLENLNFGVWTSNPAVYLYQRDSLWSFYRQYREQVLRIRLLQRRNEITMGNNWRSSRALRQQEHRMIAYRDELREVLAQRIGSEFGNSETSLRSRMLETD